MGKRRKSRGTCRCYGILCRSWGHGITSQYPHDGCRAATRRLELQQCQESQQGRSFTDDSTYKFVYGRWVCSEAKRVVHGQNKVAEQQT